MFIKLFGSFVVAAAFVAVGATNQGIQPKLTTDCCTASEPCCDTPEACCGISTAKVETAQADCCAECEGCCEPVDLWCVAGAKTASEKAGAECCYPGSPCCSAACCK
jgi:hypothetical protein